MGRPDSITSLIHWLFGLINNKIKLGKIKTRDKIIKIEILFIIEISLGHFHIPFAIHLPKMSWIFFFSSKTIQNTLISAVSLTFTGIVMFWCRVLNRTSLLLTWLSHWRVLMGAFASYFALENIMSIWPLLDYIFKLFYFSPMWSWNPTMHIFPHLLTTNISSVRGSLISGVHIGICNAKCCRGWYARTCNS